MRVVVDFDRVLFDTDAFSARLKSEGLGDMERDEKLLSEIEKRNIDWKEFVNPDAREYLKKNVKQCIVLSSYYSRKRQDNITNKDMLTLFQREKIKRSGIAELVLEVIVVGEHKHEKLLEFLAESEDDLVFVDDEYEHVAHAYKLGYRSVWMSKEERVSNGRLEKIPSVSEFPRVHSFSEFLNCVHAWENDNQKAA